MMATTLGAAAVRHVAAGKHGLLIGPKASAPHASPLAVALNEKQLDLSPLELATAMSR
jgi:hypothetical protein